MQEKRPRRQKTDYPGVTFSLKKTGEKIFYIRYRRGGRDSPLIEEPVGSSTKGMTPAKANHIRTARMAEKAPSNREIREERRRLAEAKNKWTLEKLFEEYQTTLPANFHSRRMDRLYFRKLPKDMQQNEPASIEIAEIREVRKALEARGLSPQSVRHVLAIIRRTLNWAADQELIPVADAARLRIKSPKVDRPHKTENLTDAQLERYLQALDEEKNQVSAAILRLALYTGMRKSALLALAWSDVDFTRGFITLRGEAAKNEETSIIPLNDAAREVLQGLPQTGGLIFPAKDGQKRKDISRISRRTRDKAGLPKDFRPLHGLRHSFASRIASSGQVDLYRLQTLMTHKSPAMTQRYAHLSDESMKKAAAVAAAVMSKPKGSQDGNSTQ